MIEVVNALKTRNRCISTLDSLKLKECLELHGYFPEANIIPPFIAINKKSAGNTSRSTSMPATLFVPKSSQQWRDFKLVRPENYTDTTELLTNNLSGVQEVLLAPSKIISYSNPIIFDAPSLRSGKQISSWHKMQEQLLSISSKSRLPILLQIDIQSCYHTLYTHAIEWAFEAVNLKALGGKLDTSIRRGNHNRTHGLPVGQYTSDILAECVLSWVDTRVEEALSGEDCAGVRFRDNYYFLCTDKSMAERVLSLVAPELRSAHFTINDAKTKISTFSAYYAARWQAEYDLLLESIQIGGEGQKFTNRKLKVFIQQAVSLSMNYNNEKSILEKAINLIIDTPFEGYINYKWLLFAVSNMLPLRSLSYPKLIVFMKKLMTENQEKLKDDYEDFLQSEIDNASSRNDVFALLWLGYILYDSDNSKLKMTILSQLDKNKGESCIVAELIKYLNDDHSQPILWDANTSSLEFTHKDYLEPEALNEYLSISFGES